MTLRLPVLPGLRLMKKRIRAVAVVVTMPLAHQAPSSSASATATASDRWGRTQLIDAVVTTGDGAVVAHFRGRTRTVRDR